MSVEVNIVCNQHCQWWPKTILQQLYIVLLYCIVYLELEAGFSHVIIKQITICEKDLQNKYARKCHKGQSQHPTFSLPTLIPASLQIVQGL